MKDTCNTGETKYVNGSGNVLTEAENTKKKKAVVETPEGRQNERALDGGKSK